MQPDPNDPVYSRKVIEMITVANEYCLFFEKADSYTREVILDYVLKISPLLYLKGALMPEIIPETEYYGERYFVEEDYQALLNMLMSKFGKDDVFYRIDPEEKEVLSTIPCSLAESLSDVYQDMKDFLVLYQKPSHLIRENAVFLCNEWFKTHWGPALLQIMPWIHNLVINSTPKDEGKSTLLS